MARTASPATVRAYNPAVFLVRTLSESMTARLEGPWAMLLAQPSDRFPERTSPTDQLLAASEGFALLSSAVQVAAVDTVQSSHRQVAISDSITCSSSARHGADCQSQGEGDE